MKGSDALALGIGIGGAATIAGRIYDNWPFTWNDFLTATQHAVIVSHRTDNPEAFDSWIVKCVTQNGLFFNAFDGLDNLNRLERLNRNLNLHLTAEEYARIVPRLLYQTRIPGIPMVGPVISPPTFRGITSLPVVGSFNVTQMGNAATTKRGKGGKKRINASLNPLSSVPKLLAPAPQPAENKPASNNKKRRPGRTGMNVRTRKGLGFYDEVRVAGGSDQRAREVATNRLPVKRNLPMDEAVKRNRRAVDRAVREYRNNGDWDYPTT